MIRRTFVFFISALLMSLLALPPSGARANPFEYPVFYSKFSPKQVPVEKAQGGRLKGLMKEVRKDGLVLWVAKPKEGHPTVMFFHGSTGGLAKRAWKYRWFVTRGFGVVAMSYPGSSGSKGRASTRSIMAAAHASYREIPKLVGKTKVVLMGESFGTGVAVRLAYELAQKGTPPAGIALQAPYSSGYALVRHQAPQIAGLFKGRADPWPSDRYIRKLNVPLFIMHGGKDKRVPVAHGKRLYELSPSQHKLLITRKGAGHGNIFVKEGVRPEFAKWLRARM